MDAARAPRSPLARHRLLLADDDERLRERLLRAFAARGLEARGAAHAEEALRVAAELEPTLAVVDLRMPGRSGLDLLSELVERWPSVRVLVLTGYGSIATAVASVRQGAIDYLSKPADADQILAALGADQAPSPAEPAADDLRAPSLARVEWEHIQRVLADCGGTVSQAARALGLHRRTLQRKLTTNPPRR
jgi:two-component system response regulator RegA